MIERVLTEEEYAKIPREEEKGVAIKAYAILLLCKGYSEKEVARILDVTDTVLPTLII